MRTRIGFFSWIFGALTVFYVGRVCAAGAVNPRTLDAQNTARQSATAAQSRSATNRTRAVSPIRGAITDSVSGTRARVAVATRDNSANARTAVRSASAPLAVSRVARALKMDSNARTGRNMTVAGGGLARSGVARATAVFSDVSKIGSGYAACRESYATCMDQICAEANDTYRRCFCSDRFMQFRDTENALDQAMIMLQQFQDNNLNAVDKTAAEVEAMYTATVGEQAIKRDTSAAAQMLDNINNLLSGKKTTSLTAGSSTSLGVLDLDFSTDLNDIWSNDASSLFSSGTMDLSTLEGAALFNAARNQCTRLSQNHCENNAVASMSQSSYNILITQDCNIYEKTLNTKREKVAAAVRTAEKYLREARLEEYRSHNSADVNECIAKVRTAILADTACGENYKRCLDPTGAYINGSTGEAIYTPRLFKLEETIQLSGEVGDNILNANSSYDKFLDGYRKYVTRELDTCRNIADFVWTEFKRNAIIEIAQAQSAKIEEVKSSCVDVIAQCYDSTTQSLVNMDKRTATAAGVLGRYVSADMCREQVSTCALLYAPTNSGGCTFDGRGHITSTESEQCGLASLINYVETVDDLSRVDKCADALDEYVKNLCTPSDGNYDYPYNCRNMVNDKDNDLNNNRNIATAIKKYAISNCWNPTEEKGQNDAQSFTKLDDAIQTKVESVISDVVVSIRSSLGNICESLDGVWYQEPIGNVSPTSDELLTLFYSDVFGRGTSSDVSASWGYCYKNSDKLACEAYNDYAQDDEVLTDWNSTTETCTYYNEWYQYMCSEALNGYYDADMCYIPRGN